MVISVGSRVRASNASADAYQVEELIWWASCGCETCRNRRINLSLRAGLRRRPISMAQPAPAKPNAATTNTQGQADSARISATPNKPQPT